MEVLSEVIVDHLLKINKVIFDYFNKKDENSGKFFS
jgi:hypothetical protein